ncbi:MAG: hypothetical protein ABI604_05650 [Nitrospirota bacterium]
MTGSNEVVGHLRRWSPSMIVLEGDVVFQPRQEHYVLKPWNIAAYPLANRTIESIGELTTVDLPALLGVADAHLAEEEEL